MSANPTGEACTTVAYSVGHPARGDPDAHGVRDSRGGIHRADGTHVTRAIGTNGCEGDGSLLVIMDVSGSMERTEIPAQAQVGLRLYGSTYAGDDKAVGCRDTRLVVPIGDFSGTGPRVVDAIRKARPTGFTPIGHALTEAAGDFGPEGQRAIVMVSDGEDTCGRPSPCEAAKELERSGIDVRVDTVGLFLQDNAKARQQLQCVADVTGGTYVSAVDTATLVEQLSDLSTRAIEGFVAAGEKIDGGPAQIQATPIQPGTAYVDDIVNGEARWYSFDAVSYTHLTLPTYAVCRSRWSPYH